MVVEQKKNETRKKVKDGFEGAIYVNFRYIQAKLTQADPIMLKLFYLNKNLFCRWSCCWRYLDYLNK